MTTLEEIKKQKIAQIQKQMEEEEEKQQQEEQQQAAIQQLLWKILTPEARARLKNIQLTNPSLSEKVVSVLIYLYQNQKINKKIDDNELKQLLLKLSENKRETKIKRA